MNIILGLVPIAAGLVLAFYGRYVVRLALAIVGFFAGFALAGALLASQAGEVVLVASLAAGAITAALAWALFHLAFALFGAALGLALGAVVLPPAGDDATVLWAGLAAAAVIGAVIGSLLRTPIVAGATAFVGAVLVVLGLDALAPGLGLTWPGLDSPPALISLGLALVLALLGGVAQLRRR
jgi:hypothetical protein